MPSAPSGGSGAEIAVPSPDGWRARVAADAAPLESLLDTSPGWAALHGERPFEAALQFRAALSTAPPPAPDAVVRLGAARAFGAAAESLERAADVLTLAQSRLLGPSSAPGEAAEWVEFLSESATPPAALPAAPPMAFRRAALALLRAPASPAVEAMAGPPCDVEGDESEALRRRLTACALAGRVDRALDAAVRVAFEAPATQLPPPPSAGDAGPGPPTPMVDPLPARALARVLRLEARAAVCTVAAETAAPFAFACGVAEAGLGRFEASKAAFGRALAHAVWAPEAFLPLLAFGGEDTVGELRQVAEAVAAAGPAPLPAGADPASHAAWRRGCLLRERPTACEAGLDRAAEERHLDAVRRGLDAWVERQAEGPRSLLRDLDLAESKSRARAALGARVFLRSGAVVEAFALSTAGGPPRMVAEGPTRPVQAEALSTLAVAAVATDNAQLAFDACGALAAQHPAWTGARDAVRLFGLSLLARGASGAVGGAKPE
jgi:hypothetical protein